MFLGKPFSCYIQLFWHRNATFFFPVLYLCSSTIVIQIIANIKGTVHLKCEYSTPNGLWLYCQGSATLTELWTVIRNKKAIPKLIFLRITVAMKINLGNIHKKLPLRLFCSAVKLAFCPLQESKSIWRINWCVSQPETSTLPFAVCKLIRSVELNAFRLHASRWVSNLLARPKTQTDRMKI